MKEKTDNKIKCGIIMPISPIDNCSMEHWAEVKNILEEATASIENYEFLTAIVSDADDIGIIQKRIVQNVYNSDIIICDVSGKNPNVMFELGMRLAFDKPTIIVKDNQTDYSFDTGIIEHIEYPRDLRFSKIVEFKKKLSTKLISTLEESKKNPDHSTFLKSFGQFKISSLSEQEASANKVILNSIEDLRRDISLLRRNNKRISSSHYPKEAIIKAKSVIENCAKEISATSIDTVVKDLDLYKTMMENINPQRYFPTEEEFKEFYDYILRNYPSDINY